MIRNIEFFTATNGRDLVANVDGDYTVLTETNHELIDLVYDIVHDDYTEAFKALQKMYKKRKDFKFLIVRRFLKCNFAIHDEKPDVRPDKSFELEFVPCPLRDECPVEGIVCQAKLNSTLSECEIEVVKLIAAGLTNEQIATETFRSPFTIKNHRTKILRKTGCKNSSSLIVWATETKII